LFENFNFIPRKEFLRAQTIAQVSISPTSYEQLFHATSPVLDWFNNSSKVNAFSFI
jgi:hypothetical protein